MRFSVLLLAFAAVVAATRVSQLKSQVMCGNCPGCVQCSKPETWAELKERPPPPLPTGTAPPPSGWAHVKTDYGTKTELATAEDTTNGVISCKRDFVACHKISTAISDIDLKGMTMNERMSLAAKFGDKLTCGGPVQGHGCMGSKAGPFARGGNSNRIPYPIPYKLPDSPFAPDSQDWTRPSMMHSRPEGEGAVTPAQAPYIKADVSNGEEAAEGERR